MSKFISFLKKRPQQTSRVSSQINILEEEAKLNAFAKFVENKQRLGWIGKVFGADKEKVGNITCLAIAFSLLLIPFIIFIPIEDKNTSKDRFLIIPSNIITLSLGYLFGRKFLKS